MYFDYPPPTNNTDFDQWAQEFVDTLRVGEFEIETLHVTNYATINQYSLGQIGAWDVTENTITNGTIVIDSAQNRITVDTIIIDGAENEIRVGGTNIVLDGDDEKIKVGSGTPYLDIDGGNTRIRSSNYVTGAAGAGFTLEPDLLEVGNASIRGLLRTSVFQKDVISVVGGNLWLRSADVLTSDMTAADNSTLTVEGNETFSVGDFLRIKDGTDDEWLEVTNIGSAPTYTVTRDKAAQYGADSNPAWKKGASVVNFGQSGDGGVYMTASETNAPYVTVYDQDATPWSGLTTQVRMGNLNGSYGISADKYGIAAGDSSLSNHYIIINGTDGTVEVKGSITVTGGDAFSKTNDDLDDVSDGTTYGRVNTTSISAGKIVLGGIDGSTGTLDISSSGILEISASSGLKIKSGGNVEVQSGGEVVMKAGGNITMEGSDTDPSEIVFEDTGAGTDHIRISRDASFDEVAIYPDNYNTCDFRIGSHEGTVREFENIYVTAYDTLSLTGSNRTHNAVIQLKGGTGIVDIDATEDVDITCDTVKITTNQTGEYSLNVDNNLSSGNLYIAKFDYSASAPDNNTSQFLTCEDNSAQRCIIFSDGDLANHDNSYGAISDESIKENIRDATPKLDDLLNVNVRHYNFKGYDPIEKKHIGVISQELEKVFPGLVSETSMGKTVQYSLFVPMLIKAVQELNDKFEPLLSQ